MQTAGTAGQSKVKVTLPAKGTFVYNSQTIESTGLHTESKFEFFKPASALAASNSAEETSG